MRLPSIQGIYVRGLHDQYDVSLELNPGLNVIYGKNGKGKTTLLHVLANVLEQDFRLFCQLRFQEIRVQTTDDRELLLQHVPDSQGNDGIGVWIDKQYAGYERGSHHIAPAIAKEIQEAFGPKAVYLPAFRAILDRFTPRERRGPFSLRGEQRSEEHKELMNSEETYLRSLPSSQNTFSVWYELNEVADATALKTLQCRAWFGDTVPVIRYPSLTEVEGALADEWRAAEANMSQSESKMFSEMFASVIEALADEDTNSSPQPLEQSMASLKNSIPVLDAAGYTSTEVLKRIATVVGKGFSTYDPSDNIPKKVLQLYADLMQRRVQFQLEAFKDLREFERSVNLFLDGKRLVLKSPGRPWDYKSAVFVSLNGGEREFSLQSLSSGERQIVTMLFCASRFGRDRGIFLIDEPELSLHVDWQRAILGQIMQQAKDRQVIACTHSPEVGSDHEDALKWFDPAITSEPYAKDDNESVF